MPTRMTGLIRRLRHLAKPPTADSDADLLGRFERLRDESAFAALVARYGPMVFGVCRRVLRDAHAAEDASQATFLVLARRAGSIERPDRLAGWLHGVAYRVASKARVGSRRWGRFEPLLSSDRPDIPDGHHDPLSDVSGRELLEVFEEELQRLPEALRLSVVLCCLEGLSQEEAAQRLGCTTGAIRGRLERGRKRLHERLVRRGLALPAALAAVEASRGVVSAALAGKIVHGAVAFASGGRAEISQQVIALAEGGLRAMFWTKTKVLLVVLVASGLVGTGTSWLATGPGKGNASNIAKAAGAEGDAKAKPDKAEAVSQEAKKSDQMKTLLEQRRDFAKEAFDMWQKGALASRASANEIRRRVGPSGTGDRNVIAAMQTASMQASNAQDVLYRWAERLVAAELDLSDKVSDRVATYERHLQRMKELELAFEIDAESKFHRLDAEVLLERAKAK